MFASRHTSKIDRPPSACLKIRILSSVLVLLAFHFVWFLSAQTISSLDSKRRSHVTTLPMPKEGQQNWSRWEPFWLPTISASR